MDNLEAAEKEVRRHIFVTLFLENIIFGLCLYLSINYLHYKLLIDFAISGGLALLFIIFITVYLSTFVTQPLAALALAILHLTPTDTDPIKAPDLSNLALGRELVANLISRLYEIARVSRDSNIDLHKTSSNLNKDFIANALPLPLFVLNASERIKFVNKAACKYLGTTPNDLVGKSISSVLKMSFPSEDTFTKWLKKVKQQSATASGSWERVRLNVDEKHPALLFDLAAYYNEANADSSTMLVAFDHTKQYSQDDQAVSFIALSVHELRTPLTLLKGYIEVFEQELKGNVSPEIEDFMNKMQATSEQLTAFVNNILNVARVDSDQLELKLLPEDWGSILTHIVDNFKLRAEVRGIKLDLNISPNLPKVGVDRLSIQEVVNNLLDNAIKYSGKSKSIKIKAGLNAEGLVETTVQDFGVGVPASIMPNLFGKFYRDHRNRAQIGGTGLGLYLSKAIVKAHKGDLTIRSKEGQGSTFGFSLVPYQKLPKDVKSTDNKEITRSAHGWIKNHSYNSR